MIKNNTEQLLSEFESSAGLSYEAFKEKAKQPLINIYMKAIVLEPKIKGLIEGFIENAFRFVLENINELIVSANFDIFFANFFSLSVNRQLYRYRMEHNFEGPFYIRTVVQPDIILVLKDIV